jgi:NAD(P)-dependent dehydrogenase (short-subunit alcohol dehydrogenase family)
MNAVSALFDLTGKTALITGGSGTLGSGISKILLEAGANVIVSSENQEALAKTKQELLSYGKSGAVHALLLDVSSRDELLALDQRLDDYPPVDILINGAGINIRGPILETKIEDWDRVLNTNLRGAYFVSQTVARRMMPQKRGKIIHIASLTSTMGLKYMGPYGASKSGIAQITKSMANEWAPCIQVNAIAPGYFETDMTRAVYEDPVRKKEIHGRIPYGRTGKVEDLYGGIIFFSSRASDYVTGQILYIDGGVTAS